MVEFTCLQVISQRISSVPWYVDPWWGSLEHGNWVPSTWATKRVREVTAGRKLPSLTPSPHSIPGSDFSAFLPRSHCWKQVTVSISLSIRGTYTRARKPGVGGHWEPLRYCPPHKSHPLRELCAPSTSRLMSYLSAFQHSPEFVTQQKFLDKLENG